MSEVLYNRVFRNKNSICIDSGVLPSFREEKMKNMFRAMMMLALVFTVTACSKNKPQTGEVMVDDQGGMTAGAGVDGGVGACSTASTFIQLSSASRYIALSPGNCSAIPAWRKAGSR